MSEEAVVPIKKVVRTVPLRILRPKSKNGHRRRLKKSRGCQTIPIVLSTTLAKMIKANGLIPLDQKHNEC